MIIEVYMQKLLNAIIIILLLSIIGVAIYLLFFNKIEVQRIILDKDMITIYVGDKDKIVSTIVPLEAENSSIVWRSNSESVAKVNSDGEVVGIGEGETDIIVSAKNEKVKATAHIKVMVREIEKITLSETTLNLKIGETKKITAAISPKNATYPTVVFQSSSPNIVTVDNDGQSKKQW